MRSSSVCVSLGLDTTMTRQPSHGLTALARKFDPNGAPKRFRKLAVTR